MLFYHKYLSSRHTVVTEEMENTQNNSNMQKRLVYQHKIEPGTTKVEHYGLALAAKTNLPEDTVKLAMELAELISHTTKVCGLQTCYFKIHNVYK